MGQLLFKYKSGNTYYNKKANYAQFTDMIKSMNDRGQKVEILKQIKIKDGEIPLEIKAHYPSEIIDIEYIPNKGELDESNL